MSLEAKKSSRALFTSSSVTRFYLGGTTEGTGRGGNRIIVIKIVATGLLKLQGLLPEPILRALATCKAHAIGSRRWSIVTSSVLPRQLS